MALKKMFCSKLFIHEKDVVKVRNQILNSAVLMNELLYRVAFLYEDELERYAEYKKAYVENAALRARAQFAELERNRLQSEVQTLRERLTKV